MEIEAEKIPSLVVEIDFGRRILTHVLTTYLPTVLLCIICFSTTHFKPFFFEAIVTVNLTALLVLATMFISISNRQEFFPQNCMHVRKKK